MLVLTYLLLVFSVGPAGDVDQLIRHGLRALRDCLRNEAELSTLVSVHDA